MSNIHNAYNINIVGFRHICIIHAKTEFCPNLIPTYFIKLIMMFVNIMQYQTGKTTAVGRIAVRETSVSRHYGVPIECTIR